MGTATLLEEIQKGFYNSLREQEIEKEQKIKFEQLAKEVYNNSYSGWDSEGLVRRYDIYKKAKNYEESTGNKISDKYNDMFPSKRKSGLFYPAYTEADKEEEELFEVVRNYEDFVGKAKSGKIDKKTNEVSKQLEYVYSITSKKNGKKLLRSLGLID